MSSLSGSNDVCELFYVFAIMFLFETLSIVCAIILSFFYVRLVIPFYNKQVHKNKRTMTIGICECRWFSFPRKDASPNSPC